jgi:O-Antigen ligase
MGKGVKNKETGGGNSDAAVLFKKVLFWVTAVFVFVMPLKFGLINYDVLSPEVSRTVSFELDEQLPEDLAQIMVLALILLWGAKAIFEKRISFCYTRADVFLSVFMIFVIVSTLFSSVKHSSLVGLRQFSSYFLLYYFFLNNLDDRRQRRIFGYIFLSAAGVIGLYGVYQYVWGFDRIVADVYSWAPPHLVGDYLIRIAGRRVFSTFVYPNALAGFLLLALPVGAMTAISFFRDKEKLNRYGRLVLVGVMLAATIVSFVLSGSKGGAICLAVTVFAGILILWRKSNLSSKWVIIIITAAIAGVVVFISTPGGKALVKAGKFTFSERVSYWKAGIRMVAAKPVFGHGANSFKDLYTIYKDPFANPVKNAHNNYLQLAVETGIAGAVAFVLFWLSIIFFAGRKIRSIPKEGGMTGEKSLLIIGPFLGLVGFLIHGVVDFDLYVPSITMTAIFFAAIIVKEAGAERRIELELRTSARQVVFLALLLGVCGSGIWWTKRQFEAGTHFGYGEDILYGRVKEGSPMKGTRAIEEGLRLDPFNQNYHLLLGNVYLQNRRYVKGIEHLEKARELNPISHRILFTLTMARYRHEKALNKLDVDKFLDGMEQTIRLFPSSTFYRSIYAWHLEQAGRKEEALDQMFVVIALDRGLEKTLQTLENYYDENEVNVAIEAVKSGIKISSTQPAGLF